jgi:hypothetical protein
MDTFDVLMVLIFFDVHLGFRCCDFRSSDLSSLAIMQDLQKLMFSKRVVLWFLEAIKTYLVKTLISLLCNFGNNARFVKNIIFTFG